MSSQDSTMHQDPRSATFTLSVSTVSADDSMDRVVVALETYETLSRIQPFVHVEHSEFERRAMERLCDAALKTFSRANALSGGTHAILADLQNATQQLYDLLLTPTVKEQLQTTEARNLLLYTDDRLVQLPWELLFDEKDFLCQRFNMGRIVRTEAQPPSRRRKPSPPLKMLVIADPDGTLPEAAAEGLSIKNCLDQPHVRVRSTYRPDDRSERAIRVTYKSKFVERDYVINNLRKYDIVHYAGHGHYSPEAPEQRGWQLRDGLLSCTEVLRLYGSRNPFPLLVFSNACRTGEMEGWLNPKSGVYGLAHAFLQAGVQMYIGTFADVPSEVSQNLAAHFYAELARGQSVGESLRQARLHTIQRHGQEKLGWASYMLYGDPTYRFFASEHVSSRDAPSPRICSVCLAEIPQTSGDRDRAFQEGLVSPAHSCRYCGDLICEKCWTEGKIRECRRHQLLEVRSRDVRMQSASLMMSAGPTKRNICLLSKAHITLGRQRGSDIICRLLPPSTKHNREAVRISQKHCVIEFTGKGLFLKDLDSTNGTFIGDPPRKINGEIRLDSGDQFNMANVLACKVTFYSPSIGSAQITTPIDYGASPLADAMSKHRIAAIKIERLNNLHEEEEYIIVLTEAHIGESPRNPIVISGCGLAPVHARLVYYASQYWIQPMDSHSKTAVDGQSLRPSELFALAPGMRVQLGHASLEFNTLRQLYINEPSCARRARHER